MNFKVNISMDKKEMSHPRNVANALHRVAEELFAKYQVNDTVEETKTGLIRDVNGAIIGTWILEK